MKEETKGVDFDSYEDNVKIEKSSLDILSKKKDNELDD